MQGIITLIGKLCITMNKNYTSKIAGILSGNNKYYVYLYLKLFLMSLIRKLELAYGKDSCINYK